MAGNLPFFALFYFVFEGNFQVQAPRGAYIWRGDLTEGFLRYEFGGLIFGGAYTWTGLFGGATHGKFAFSGCQFSHPWVSVMSQIYAPAAN